MKIKYNHAYDTAEQIATYLHSKKVLFDIFNGTFLHSQVHATFLGIPIISMNYTSTVIPIILAV